MGDIAFDIEKNVDLNKQVNLDIDKDVNANVNNDDLLATAEADAEAFGEDALAETDAFTYVNGEGGEPGQPVVVPGETDVLGNTIDIILGPTSDFTTTTGETVTLAETLTVDFNADGDLIPDVDDINGFGVLDVVSAPPPDIADVPIPDPLLSITDLNLALTGDDILFTSDGDLEAEYTITADWIVNFGPRELDLDGDGTATVSDLLLTIPAGTDFEALYTGPGEIPPVDPPGGPIEVIFEAFVGGNDGFYTHDGVDYPLTGFVFEAQSLQEIDIADIGDYAFEAIANFFAPGPDVPGDGEAFSYGESTAALDLGGDGNDNGDIA